MMTGRSHLYAAAALIGLISFQGVLAQSPSRSPRTSNSLVDRLDKLRQSLLKPRDQSGESKSSRPAKTGDSWTATKKIRPRTARQRTAATNSRGDNPKQKGPSPILRTARVQDRAEDQASRSPVDGIDAPTTEALEYEPARRARPATSSARGNSSSAQLSGDSREPTLARERLLKPRLSRTVDVATESKPDELAAPDGLRTRDRPGFSDAPNTPDELSSEPSVTPLGEIDSESNRPITGGPRPRAGARPQSLFESRPDPAASRVRRLTPRVTRAPVTRNRDLAPAAEETSQDTDPVSTADSEVLSTQQTPNLMNRVTGPRTIVVGRPAKFQIAVANTATVEAEDAVIHITIPAWAKVEDSKPTVGTTQYASPSNHGGTLTWTIGTFGAKSKEQLELSIVPLKGQPLELSVSSTFAPPASRAVVEVQEPKLDILVSGPEEMLYGESKRYELMLSNPGTGPAENVVINLLRLGSGEKVADVHKVGTLQPGASKKIALEFVARQTGTVLVKARAHADGGLRSEAAKEVLVRRPGLRVDLDGPRAQYAGTMATYRIRVTNPGTATADSVTVSAALPQGAKFVEASGGGRYVEDDARVTWDIGSLDSDAETDFELKCVLKSPGKNRVEVMSEASTDLTDSSASTTDVVAVADLTLDVRDPTGPIAVNDVATYEIRIQNRGTKLAEGIEVVTFFSDGIEPVSADGGQHELGSGQVAFQTIGSLEAGGDLVLKIKAQASRPGNHVCRTEVVCRSVDTKLAEEETTRFYGEELSARPIAEAAGPFVDAEPQTADPTSADAAR